MTSFSLSGGVQVFGFISPSDTTDQYPVIDPLYGIDGFRNVDTLSDLNNIPTLRRRAGMVVGVSGGTTYYKLNLPPWNNTITDWSIFNTGGGSSSFTGGTVSGPTEFTNGLTADTISASTYLNLPLDVYVTGGTYSGDTITFTNNTGGTFNVSGITSSTQFTGGTVSGSTEFLNGLTANTISASTYQNLPLDIFVTGGTYSAGTTTFTNNSGGTFNVSGFYTGETSYVNSLTTGVGLSGDSTSGNITIINTDPDQVVTISGGTGIVTGGTYPNFEITNSLPDQTVVLNNGSNISVTGTYPNFTIDVTGLTDNDIYVTGFTYSANTFTIYQSSGSSFNSTIDIMTGLTINGNLLTNQIYIENNQININYSQISATTGTSISSGLKVQDGNGLISGDTYFTIGQMDTFIGGNVSEYSGSTGYTNRGWITQLNDIVIRNTNLNNSAPDGNRLIAENDVLDGGSY